MKDQKRGRKEKLDKTSKDSKLKSIQQIDDFIQEARAYLKIKEANSTSFKHDLRLEGMLPILTGDIPVFIHANEIRQIEAAVYWADRQNMEMVLVGGKDSWRATTLLKERDIPVMQVIDEAISSALTGDRKHPRMIAVHEVFNGCNKRGR